MDASTGTSSLPFKFKSNFRLEPTSIFTNALGANVFEVKRLNVCLFNNLLAIQIFNLAKTKVTGLPFQYDFKIIFAESSSLGPMAHWSNGVHSKITNQPGRGAL